MTYEELKSNREIATYIEQADASLCALGYTEHSFAHVCKVADTVRRLLQALNFSEHDIELGQMAAYLHDIGNLVNRVDHSQSGAIMAFRLLDRLGMASADIAAIVTAIGNHDEGTGVPVSPIAAALIIADKSDVRRSRVRNHDVATFDIHDRVNYSVTSADLKIDTASSTLCLALQIDTRYSPVMDYFEIFLDRMILCRKAAETLALRFSLEINQQKLL